MTDRYGKLVCLIIEYVTLDFIIKRVFEKDKGHARHSSTSRIRLALPPIGTQFCEHILNNVSNYLSNLQSVKTQIFIASCTEFNKTSLLRRVPFSFSGIQPESPREGKIFNLPGKGVSTSNLNFHISKTRVGSFVCFFLSRYLVLPRGN